MTQAKTEQTTYLAVELTFPPGSIFAVEHQNDIALQETDFVFILRRVRE